jgi:hypothetical protein
MPHERILPVLAWALAVTAFLKERIPFLAEIDNAVVGVDYRRSVTTHRRPAGWLRRHVPIAQHPDKDRRAVRQPGSNAGPHREHRLNVTGQRVPFKLYERPLG